MIGDGFSVDVPGEIPRSIYFYNLENGSWLFKKRFWKDFGGFGNSISISGNWTAVGGDPVNQITNHVYLYQVDGDSIYEKQFIPFDDTLNISSNPQFGRTVKLYNDYLFVTAPNWQDSVNTNPGALYIYKRQVDDNWMQIHRIKIKELSGGDGDFFDFNLNNSLDVYGNTLAISIFKLLPNEDAFTKIVLIEYDENSFQEIATDEFENLSYTRSNDIYLEGEDLIISDPGWNGNRGRILFYKTQSSG